MLLAAAPPALPASGRTYYIDAKLAVARGNLARHVWARKERDAIVGRASRWLKYDDAKLRALVPPPQVPRAARVHALGCPVHGPAMKRHGDYAWRISFDDPWKVRCPEGGEAYPSNDFAAFMASGFKDRSLLTGEHPDDGWGWSKPGVSKKLWFVAFYAHWSVTRFLRPAIEDLSKAYLLTDDPRYAHACALLLWQYADHYPLYQYEKQSRYGTEFMPWYKGRLHYHTWECFNVQAVGPAYDAVRPAIAGDKALQALAKQSPQEIQRHIEERLLRTMARDIMDGSHRIQGNYGMHQVGLLGVAAALKGREGKPTSQEMIDWVLHNDRGSLYTDAGLYDALFNLVHRDGYPFESPSYNCGWMRDLTRVGDALEDVGVPVFQMPRLRKLLTWPLKMMCAGEFTPPLGDSNNMFAGALGLNPLYNEGAFRRYRDPAIARAWVQRDSQLPHDLFREPLDSAVADAAREHPGPVGVHSSLLPALGFATLQTGDDANRTAASVFYGRFVGHAHYDRLHIDLYSHHWSLLPDFGYPETADTFDPRRYGFFSHNLTHNTVMVDARRQATARGRLVFYDPGPAAQAVEVAAEPAYPGVVDLYRRTLILVDAAPDKAYLVDIFRVRGGRQHDWIAHGTQADFAADFALSPPRTQGTLAGPDVAYGSFYDDPKLRDKPRGTVRYHTYEGSAFQFLFDVQRGRLDGSGRAEWRLTRDKKLYPHRPTSGVALRAHLVGRGEEVIVCNGKPQNRRTWPETVKFLLRRRTGEGIESIFVTVFEPYRGKPFLSAVRSLPVAGPGLPVALEVTAVGQKHLVFSTLEPQARTIRFAGQEAQVDAAVCVLVRAKGGHIAKAYALDGRRVQCSGLTVESQAAASARVRRVDYDRGLVELTEPILAGHPPAGSVAIVESSGHAAAVPVHQLVNGSAFLVGDDDLCAGRLTVDSVTPEGVRVRPRYAYWIEPGMTIVNEDRQPVARVRSLHSGVLRTDPEPLDKSRFPDTDRDGKRRLWAMVIGPGDRVTVHASVRITRPAANGGPDEP